MILEKLKTRYLVWIFSLLLFGAGGYYLGQHGVAVSLSNNPQRLVITNKEPLFRPSAKPSVDFSLFWQVWQILNEKSVDQPLSGQKLLYGAIKGLAASLEDPYTLFLPPEAKKALDDSLNGDYEGIGAELGFDRPPLCSKDPASTQLVVIAPLDGSPALRAKLKACDRILKIDDKVTTGLSLTEAVSLIRGKQGTEVQLTLQRDNADPFVIKIKREKINIPSVKWERKEDKIVYLRLSRFGEDTSGNWDTAMAGIEASLSGTPSTLILDLRGNAGGYVDSAIHIASDFLESGKIILSEQFGDGTRKPFVTNKTGKLSSVPVVILVDGGSASAAEILAAALRDNHNSKLIGEKTFGKGVVQESDDLPDGSAIHVTIAKWLTPKGEVIHGKGLEPDFKVDITVEELNNNKDPQLEKALEVARSLSK